MTYLIVFHTYVSEYSQLRHLVLRIQFLLPSHFVLRCQYVLNCRYINRKILKTGIIMRYNILCVLNVHSNAEEDFVSTNMSLCGTA